MLQNCEPMPNCRIERGSTLDSGYRASPECPRGTFWLILQDLHLKPLGRRLVTITSCDMRFCAPYDKYAKIQPGVSRWSN